MYRAPTLFSPGSLQRNVPETEPDCRHKQELYQTTGKIIGYRHPSEDQSNPRRMEYGGDHCRREDTVQLAEAGESPQAVVQMKPVKYKQYNYGINRSEPDESSHVIGRNTGKTEIKPQKQSQKIRKIHCDHIIKNQIKRNNMPVFYAGFLQNHGKQASLL